MSRLRWIVLAICLAALAVRLIRIDQPFIDQWSWRQSDVAAIARNFYTNGFHFAHPQIDWAGDAAGYVGTEFPILPFAAAVTYKLAGVHDWIGRVETLLFCAGSLPFFFLLVRELFGESAAAWATFFYAFAPLSIAASRAFMPDIPSLTLALVGMYFYLRWLKTDRLLFFAISAMAVSLALLIKLPTALIGAALLYITWERFGPAFVRQPAVWLYGAIALLPSAAWYWHAYRIAQLYYPHHFFGAGGFSIENAPWYWRIARQTALSSLTPVLAALAMFGVFAAEPGKYRRAFHWWAVVMVLFVIAAGWGNRHQWYQLPFGPIAAVLAGCACERFGNRIRPSRRTTVALLIAAAFAIPAWFATRPFFAPAAAPLRNLGLALKEISPPSALVIAADDGDPTIFYYAERKGWHFLENGGVFYGNPVDDAQLIDDYDRLRGRGGNFIVFTFGTRWWLEYYGTFARHLSDTATLVAQSDDFVIYRITATRL